MLCGYNNIFANMNVFVLQTSLQTEIVMLSLQSNTDLRLCLVAFLVVVILAVFLFFCCLLILPLGKIKTYISASVVMMLHPNTHAHSHLAVFDGDLAFENCWRLEIACCVLQAK